VSIIPDPRLSLERRIEPGEKHQTARWVAVRNGLPVANPYHWMGITPEMRAMDDAREAEIQAELAALRDIARRRIELEARGE